MARDRWRRAGLLAGGALVLGCGGSPAGPPVPPTEFPAATRPRALVVVSPHPDDETLLAGALLHRAAADPRTALGAIYLSGGDATGWPGACEEESEAARKRKVVAQREAETRAAWQTLGVASPVLHFLRHPDQQLVAHSELVDGRRRDELTPSGERAVGQVEALLPSLVPAGARELVVVTASFWDAHPDHRTAYRAARAGARKVRALRDIPVTLLHGIVHDESRIPLGTCCPGDFFWPRRGPQDDHAALLDSRARPRPPPWDVVYDARDALAVRQAALRAHRSQVEGDPELCITGITVAGRFMEAFLAKTQEPFYREEISGGPAAGVGARAGDGAGAAATSR